MLIEPNGEVKSADDPDVIDLRKPPSPLQRAAQTAITALTNESVAEVSRLMTEAIDQVLRPYAAELDLSTTEVNHHPIVTLFVSRMAKLNGGSAQLGLDTIRYIGAIESVREIAEPEIPELSLADTSRLSDTAMPYREMLNETTDNAVDIYE
jgi:hypothetical protein